MKPLYDRLRTKTVIEGDCWLYIGQPSLAHPRIPYRGRHRTLGCAVLMEEGHTLEWGDKACHTCDRPSCWNPEHLYKGTDQSNMNDKYARGRANHPVGEACPAAKLTDEKVRHVLSLRGKIIAREAARLFGISVSQVCNIWRGDSWKHIHAEFEPGALP